MPSDAERDFLIEVLEGLNALTEICASFASAVAEHLHEGDGLLSVALKSPGIRRTSGQARTLKLVHGGGDSA